MLPQIPPWMRAFALCRRALCLALTAAACGLLQPPAAAQTLDLSLNVLYSNPANPNSGGAWQLVGKSSHSGIAGVEALLRNVSLASIQQASPQGTVNGGDLAGFNEFLTAPGAGYTRVLTAQRTVFPTAGEEEGAFYGVGTLTNGSPNFPGKPIGTNSIGPTYSSLTNVSGVPWATGDVFSDPAWSTAALLATGTFAPGLTPSFFQSAGLMSTGSVFTSTGSATSFGSIATVDPVTSTVVRTNLMITADYNQNGIVDAADYTIWRDTFGSTTDLRADGDGSNVIDQADYTIWKTNFGAMPGSGGALGGSAVPEPTACILLFIAACGLATSRRRAN